MSKIPADVRKYQNQACAAGFYHATNLAICYLHVQVFANRYFDRRSDCERVQAYPVCAHKRRFLLLPLLSGNQTLRGVSCSSTPPFRQVGGTEHNQLRCKLPAPLGACWGHFPTFLCNCRAGLFCLLDEKSLQQSEKQAA